MAAFSNSRRSLGGAEVACSSSSSSSSSSSADADLAGASEGASSAAVAEARNAATAAVKVEERPWLGNGPDPMAKTTKIRPGTWASLTAGLNAPAEDKTRRVWVGNGPDPMASLGEAAAASRAEKGNGVPVEEMWLNGPFKAPVPAEPLVRQRGAQGQAAIVMV